MKTRRSAPSGNGSTASETGTWRVRDFVTFEQTYTVGEMPMLISEQDGRFSSGPVSGNIHSLVDLPAQGVSQAASRRAA